MEPYSRSKWRRVCDEAGRNGVDCGSRGVPAGIEGDCGCLCQPGFMGKTCQDRSNDRDPVEPTDARRRRRAIQGGEEEELQGGKGKGAAKKKDRPPKGGKGKGGRRYYRYYA